MSTAFSTIFINTLEEPLLTISYRPSIYYFSFDPFPVVIFGLETFTLTSRLVLT
jgi:hypothetical protein